MPIAQPTYFSQLKTQIKHLPIIGAIATATWTQLKHLYQTTKQSYTRIILNILMKRVEYYQPLYNHPLNPTKHPQRICIDRATTIYQRIEAWGKGGRILDIGCSLGYFAYYFAERDYLVDGIDFDPKNIKVCNLLQNLNKPKVNFAVAEFSTHYLKTITANQFDIVFLFSVMHHITHAHGLDYAQTLMAELTEKIPVLFIELAIKEEQTTAAWRQSLPENELAIFDKCSDISIEKIGTYPNHLSTVLRPLYLVKKKTMSFFGKTYSIHARKFIPYQGFYEADCRYYDCGNTFIKKYAPSIKSKLDQLTNEINLYQLLPKNNFFPTLLAYTQEEDNVEIKLSKLPGVNLYDHLIQGKTIARLPVFTGIIKALHFLLKAGLYHNDVRLWNVMVDDENTYLFDLGLADKLEKENTNLALQWIIAQMHQLNCGIISYPLTIAPDFSALSLEPAFLPIIQALQTTKSFAEFVETFKLD